MTSSQDLITLIIFVQDLKSCSRCAYSIPLRFPYAEYYAGLHWKFWNFRHIHRLSQEEAPSRTPKFVTRTVNIQNIHCILTNVLFNNPMKTPAKLLIDEFRKPSDDFKGYWKMTLTDWKLVKAHYGQQHQLMLTSHDITYIRCNRIDGHI